MWIIDSHPTRNYVAFTLLSTQQPYQLLQWEFHGLKSAHIASPAYGKTIRFGDEEEPLHCFISSKVPAPWLASTAPD